MLLTRKSISSGTRHPRLRGNDDSDELSGFNHLKRPAASSHNFALHYADIRPTHNSAGADSTSEKLLATNQDMIAIMKP
jgi:hypothetical protein